MSETEETLEIPIVPKPLNAKSISQLNSLREKWNIEQESPTAYVFSHKSCKSFTCMITVIGQNENRNVSFVMHGHPNLKKLMEKQNLDVFADGAGILAFIASLE